MIAILSPSKTLDLDPIKIPNYTLPSFTEQSIELVSVLKKKNSTALKKLMNISDKLSSLNVERYSNFQNEFTPATSKPAIHTFKGDVFIGLGAEDFTKPNLKFAQKSVRILSGLYGVLKPMDLIQAYRLEMGTKLKVKKAKNLYEFWGSNITDLLNAELAEFKKPVLINLASNEYAKAIQFKDIKAEIINIDFREYRGDDLKFISFNAKKARGLMARYMVKNKITSLGKLKGFNYEDYSFSEELSTVDRWMFVR